MREVLIVLAFCLLTSVQTWPYVTRLRDAVAGPGDPYLVAWILWWDYHQTFNDPLNLFHANILYPHEYTLAFSEHCYGVALPFFPLFALGFRPLTVHAVAMFLGFALSGYGAFRLARTLTSSYGIAWVAGIIFAFTPYRFGLMAQLVYLFSMWIPLLFEALVLFARNRTNKRAAWLAVAFFMTGLSSVTWLLLSLVPLAVSAALLLTRYRLWRDRDFWRRGSVALVVASAALLPFMLPYYIVSRRYGYKRRIDDVQAHSAQAISWLVAEGRSKIWSGMGASFPDSSRFQLFPGLLPLLLALSELLLGGRVTKRATVTELTAVREKWVRRLDALAVFAFAISIPAAGFDRTAAFGGVFDTVTSERALTILTASLIVRLCLSYPDFLRRANANLIDTIRSARRCDAFWIGIVLTVLGFCYSLGWNFFFFRIHYDLLLPFKSIRAPMRAAILACLGLALLAGLGTRALAELLSRKHPRVRPAMACAVACALLLAELNAAPLYFIRGEFFPDAVTLRLKNTPMRGGIVELPSGIDLNTRYMLRAADHAKPLINATSGFIPPHVDEIEQLTRTGPIALQFLDLLEKIPASYVVINNHLVTVDRRTDFAAFLAVAVASDRLRFVNRFGSSDLYAVSKTEPEAKSEATFPAELNIRDWASMIEHDPSELLGRLNWSQTLYRIRLVSLGKLPRFVDFMSDVKIIGRAVVPGMIGQERQLDRNLREFTEDWTLRSDFVDVYSQLNDAQYVDRLLTNAGISITPDEREMMIAGLANKQETRATTLLKVVNDRRFVEQENHRSLVVLHFFGYFQRNPDDPPDNDLRGMEHWILDLQRNNDPARISRAFADSIEYQQLKRFRVVH